MHFKPIPFKHSDDYPFADDKLKREHCAEVLTQIVSAVQVPFVLAVDSPWGTGKTTFIEMWMRYLKKQDYPCLCFNAWEHDFAGDPLLSSIGELEAVVSSKSLDPSSIPKVKKHFAQVMKYAGLLTRRAIPVAVKVATAGALDLDKFTEDALADLTERLVKEKIENYESEKTTVKGFKDSLIKFVDQIQPIGNKNKKPLVFFVDELDRCRPTYAIELLEKIKHFFTIPGIVFVLAIDKSQVGHSIRAIYGTNMDVDGYLRRFIDHEYRLPDPAIEDFCNALYDRFEFQSYFQGRHDTPNERKNLLVIFSQLATALGFTLRIVEQCFSQISIVLRTINANQPLHEYLLATLVVLKADNKELYSGLVSGRTEGKTIVEYLRKRMGSSYVDQTGYMNVVEAYLASIYQGKTNASKAFEEYVGLINRATLGTHEKEWANSVKIPLEYMRNFRPDPFVYLIKKIELLERFVY